MNRVYFLIVFIILSLTVKSQNQDSIFQRVRALGFSGNYAEAQLLCEKLIASEPANIDYQLFLARLFSWQNDYPSARKTINSLPSSQKSGFEAMDLLIDIEQWSGNYEEAIRNCNKLLEADNKNDGIIVKKAKSQYLAEDYKTSLISLNDALAINPKNSEALKYKDLIQEKLLKNQISISYLNTNIANASFNSWNFTSVEYKRNFDKCPVLIRGTYGNLNPGSGAQFEVDAYPKLAKGTYLYLNSGFSTGNSNFPIARAAGDIYQKVLKSFEISAGLRYMHFQKDDALVYTPSLSCFINKWALTYRAYFVNLQPDLYTSHFVQTKRYCF